MVLGGRRLLSCCPDRSRVTSTRSPAMVWRRPTISCGAALAGPGDIEGMIHDLLIGAWGHDVAGAFSGRGMWCWTLTPMVISAMQMHTSMAPRPGMLDSGRRRGRHRRDGHADIVVGAYGHDEAPSAVRHGCSPRPPTPRLDDAAASIRGTDVDVAGWSVDLQDTDGDGRADAHRAPGTRTAAPFLAR